MPRSKFFMACLLPVIFAACDENPDSKSKDTGDTETDSLPDSGEDSGEDTEIDSGDSKEPDTILDTGITKEEMGLWGQPLDEAASTVFVGEPRRRVGSEVTGNADFDGDLLPDLVIHAQNAYRDTDFLVVFSSPFEPIMGWDEATAWIQLKYLGDPYLGNPEQHIDMGDLNGDGLADLLYREPEDTYCAHVRYGGFTGEAASEDSDVHFVTPCPDTVAYINDSNGDGQGEALFGHSWDRTGMTYLFNGPLLGLVELSSATATIMGEDRDEWDDRSGSGYSVSDAGDINADGLTDIIISAVILVPVGEHSEHIGAVYLMYGPVVGSQDLSFADGRYYGEIEDGRGTQIGTDIDAAGDVNGDGYGDFIVGSYTQSIFLIHGPAEGEHLISEADARMLGYSYDEAGESVAGPGDVNGDGFDDIFIGAPSAPIDIYGFEGYWGGAYLVTGPASGIIDLHEDSYRWRGVLQGDNAGIIVAAAGDVNADGLADMATVAPFSFSSYVIPGGDY